MRLRVEGGKRSLSHRNSGTHLLGGADDELKIVGVSAYRPAPAPPQPSCQRLHRREMCFETAPFLATRYSRKSFKKLDGLF